MFHIIPQTNTLYKPRVYRLVLLMVVLQSRSASCSLCLCLCLYLCLCLCLCLCVICAFNYDLREDVNMAIARASQFWWLGLRAFTASFPIYLWFLFGPIPAILLLTSLILTHLCLHFFCCTQREIPQDSQYNNHPPQSELLTHVL